MKPGRPEYRKPNAWDAAFMAESRRRAAEIKEAEEQLAKRDIEPGRAEGDEHEVIWVTPEVAACPQCKRSYRKLRYAHTTSMEWRGRQDDEYLERWGMYAHAERILRQRQQEREAREAANKAGKQSKNSKGRQRIA